MMHGGMESHLEEGSLGGIHAGGASIDVHIVGGNQTHTGGGADLVLVDLVLDLVQVTVGEDQTNVADQVLNQAAPLLAASGLAVQVDGALHHGVLTHQDDGAGAQTLQGKRFTSEPSR